MPRFIEAALGRLTRSRDSWLTQFQNPLAQALRDAALQNQGRNNMVARYGYQGIYATDASRAPRDVRGQHLSVRFWIVDERPPAAVADSKGGDPKSLRGPYTVAVTLQGVGVEEMNMGDQPVIGMVDTYKEPGVYELSIPCPRTRSTVNPCCTRPPQLRTESRQCTRCLRLPFRSLSPGNNQHRDDG